MAKYYLTVMASHNKVVDVQDERGDRKMLVKEVRELKFIKPYKSATTRMLNKVAKGEEVCVAVDAFDNLIMADYTFIFKDEQGEVVCRGTRSVNGFDIDSIFAWYDKEAADAAHPYEIIK